MRKVFTLAITTLTLAGIMALVGDAPALAEGNARFKMAGNVWEKEKPIMPKHFGRTSQPQHGVTHGAVPKNMFGLTPKFLEKPKPQMVPASNPFIRPTVAAQPMPRQTVKGHYDSKFGQPNQSKPTPLVASQPKKLPDFGSPRALSAPQQPAVQAERNVAAKLARPAAAKAPRAHRAHQRSMRHSEQVAGKLVNQPKKVARVAIPKRYNGGYESGGFTPAKSKVGSSAKSDVYGKIISNF